MKEPKLAVFLATSGHSGVDRIMGLLLPCIASKGIKVDLLHVKGKGPYLPQGIQNLSIIELGSSHSFTSLVPLIRYLRSERPDALLSDKDRVNQVALISNWLTGNKTRMALRFGQTVTKMLEDRDIVDRGRHYLSMRFLYPSADAIICPSEGAAQDLSRFAGISRESITVIPNPIDQNRIFQLSAEPIDHPWFQKDGVPVVVGLGELTQRKGFDTLIRAFSIMRQKKAARLVVIGRGRGKSELENLSRKLNIENDLQLLGFIGNPFPYLGKADLFVQASRYEGFGMALLEALTLGVPSVATDCPSGPREILQGGRYGQLVPIGNAEEMAKAMMSTLDNPPASSFLKEGAVPYSLEKVLDMYLQCLNLKEPGQ